MSKNNKGRKSDLWGTRCIQIVLMLATLPGLALAAEDEVKEEADEAGFKILTGVGVQATDNLFASNSNRVSDVITTGTLGFSMKAAYSRQRLALDAAFNDNRYDAHPDWNYVGNNLSGQWLWSSGTGLHGAVTGSQVTAQNPITVNAGSTQRNLNTTQNSQVSVGYELSGGWDLNTGLVYSSSKNEGAVLGQTNYQYNGVFVSATYAFRSGNTLTLTTQSANGNNLYDYSIRSNELKFVSKDPETVGYTWQLIQWNQSYAQHPEYDFSVLGGGATVAWPITAKTSAAISAQRQFYGNISTTSVYSISDSIALVPAWEVSPKVTLRGTIQYGVIRDQGDPGGGASGRVDRFETQSVGLYWALQENLLISTIGTRTERTSNISGLDFIVNQLTLQATYTF